MLDAFPRGSAPLSLRLFSGATLVAFGLLSLLPVVVLFAQSVRIDGRFSLEAYGEVLSHARQWGLLRNTVIIAAGTTVLATLIGAPVGLALDYWRVPGRRVLAFAAAMPLLVPPYISAVVWADALGRQGLLRFGLNPVLGDTSLPIYSTAGCIFVLGLAYYPIVAFATVLGLRRYDARLEEAALLVARRGHAFASITLPLLAPALISGAVLVFVLSLIEFSVPSLLQVNVYTVEIYERFSVSYDAPAAAAQSVPLVVTGVLVLGAGWLYVRGRRGRLAGQGRPSSLSTASGASAWTATVLCALPVALASLLPFGLLFYRSLPLTSYVEVWQTAREELATSLLVGALSATVLTLLAGAMACLARWKRPAARLFPLSLASFLVSGPLLGVALILVWNRPGLPALVYDTLAILVVACAGRFLFFAWGAVFAAQADLPRRLDEAAAVAGAPWHMQARGILLPLLMPALIAVWGLGFLLAFRELDAAVLVAPPGRSTLAVRLFGLMHYGPSRLVAALSVVTVAVILAGALATALLYARARGTLDARR